MNRYRLNIELSFESEADAQALMDACEPLIGRSSVEAESELIKALEERIQENIRQANLAVMESVKNNDAILDLLSKANAVVSEMRSAAHNAEVHLDDLRKSASAQIAESQDKLESVKDFVKDGDNLIEATFQKLSAFNDELKEAREYVESLNFLRDMMNVAHNVVTGGKVQLSEYIPAPGYGSENMKWITQKAWDVQRSKEV